MNRRRARRISLFFLALIIFAIPIITPLLELPGGHNHTCSPSRCLVCKVSGTLGTITDAFAAFLCAFLPFIILFSRKISLLPRPRRHTDTPIALKTKILS